MKIEAIRVEVDEITPLRELHRQAMNCQIMHDSFPRRGLFGISSAAARRPPSGWRSSSPPS